MTQETSVPTLTLTNIENKPNAIHIKYWASVYFSQNINGLFYGSIDETNSDVTSMLYCPNRLRLFNKGFLDVSFWHNSHFSKAKQKTDYPKLIIRISFWESSKGEIIGSKTVTMSLIHLFPNTLRVYVIFPYYLFVQFTF